MVCGELFCAEGCLEVYEVPADCDANCTRVKETDLYYLRDECSIAARCPCARPASDERMAVLTAWLKRKEYVEGGMRCVKRKGR